MADTMNRLAELTENICSVNEVQIPGSLCGAGAIAALDGTGRIEITYSPDCTLAEFMEVAEEAIQKDAELDALERGEGVPL